MGRGKAVVISDDTDVFVLLLHFISTGDIKAKVLMQPTSANADKVIGIAATYHKHISIMPNILPAHALPRCDTVGSYFGIGKPTIIEPLKSNATFLTSIGELTSSLQLCETEGTNLLLSCFKQAKVNSLMETRMKVWKYHASKNNTSALKLKSWGLTLKQQYVKVWLLNRPLLTLLITFEQRILVHCVWYQQPL